MRQLQISTTIAVAVLAPLAADYVVNAVIFDYQSAVPAFLLVGAMGFGAIVVVYRMRVLAGLLPAAIAIQPRPSAINLQSQI